MSLSNTDDAIREKVLRLLLRDGLINAHELKVDVQQGVVTLTGKVNDRKTKKYAEQSLEGVNGILYVVNQLSLKEDHGLIGNLEWPI